MSGRVWTVILPFAAGYCLSYVYRSVNAIIAPDLSTELALAPADLGLLTSAYFFTFAAIQLPLGILLDRFGPRRVEAALLLCAVMGASIFALSDTLSGLIIGRGLIGLGVSACLMAAFKATNLWFDARDLPLVNGCVMAAGGLGAMFATAPVETLLHHTDWRGLFGGLALLTLVVAMALFVIVPEHDDSRPAKRTSLGESIAGVRLVFSDPRFWRVAPVTAASQASFFGIQGLWAGPWMRDVAGLARDMVATHLLAIAASMVAGYVLLGGLATTLTRLGIHARVVAGAGIGIFIGLQAVIVLAPEAARLPVWMLFGFFATTAILYYPILSQSFSSGLAGRVLTGLNVLVFASAFAAQWGMGIIIGLWEADITGRYPLRAYQSGFGLALLVQLVAFVWLIMPRSERAANSRR